VEKRRKTFFRVRNNVDNRKITSTRNRIYRICTNLTEEVLGGFTKNKQKLHDCLLCIHSCFMRHTTAYFTACFLLLFTYSHKYKYKISILVYSREPTRNKTNTYHHRLLHTTFASINTINQNSSIITA
ncbi:MAG: hypothetical protein ACI8RD_004539, partial [Bacillariaceae sp.]|jgi:hypothetical protein